MKFPYNETRCKDQNLCDEDGGFLSCQDQRAASQNERRHRSLPQRWNETEHLWNSRAVSTKSNPIAVDKFSARDLYCSYPRNYGFQSVCMMTCSNWSIAGISSQCVWWLEATEVLLEFCRNSLNFIVFWQDVKINLISDVLYIFNFTRTIQFEDIPAKVTLDGGRSTPCARF